MSLHTLWATAHLCLPSRPSSASGLVSGPAVGPVGTSETLMWPNSCVCYPQSPQLPELDHFHLWEHSLSTQIIHRGRVYLGDHGDLICSLDSWWKEFQSFSLVPLSLGFSFGFIPASACGPPTGVWSWGCLGALESAPSEDRVQRWYDCLDRGSPSGAKCAGKLAATGTRDMALVRAFSRYFLYITPSLTAYNLGFK